MIHIYPQIIWLQCVSMCVCAQSKKLAISTFRVCLNFSFSLLFQYSSVYQIWIEKRGEKRREWKITTKSIYINSHPLFPLFPLTYSWYPIQVKLKSCQIIIFQYRQQLCVKAMKKKKCDEKNSLLLFHFLLWMMEWCRLHKLTHLVRHELFDNKNIYNNKFSSSSCFTKL